MVGASCQAVLLGPLGMVSEKDTHERFLKHGPQQATPPAVVTSITIAPGYAGRIHDMSVVVPLAGKGLPGPMTSPL